MNGMMKLLPNEHLSAAPARWHFLGATGAIEHTLEALGVKQVALKPTRLMSTEELVISDLLTKQGTSNSHFSNGMAAYEMSFLRPNEENLYAFNRASLKIVGSHSILPNRWRWCPDCVEEDNDIHGISYYHRDHQLPGVFHCHKHKHKLGLVDSCHECGFHVSSLKSLCVPPYDNKCPNCGMWMSSYDGIFTAAMAAIETASLGLVQNQTYKNRQQASITAIRDHAGLKQVHENSLPERKRLINWLDAFSAHYQSGEIRAFFNQLR
ncbi:TniQ family protein [Vibrio sp. 404]|uniref:TniQ family protein n=1 Tax=Vibrio marinisediminis TaxID=2758441 RepID=A0A7W2ISB1_9VIBR|nr:TniQ family protein [Vibrio marinisediminis]MBA5760942.1 TniQ family protein [Vibrio marinisediminis]